jgi:Zn-dependent protease
VTASVSPIFLLMVAVTVGGGYLCTLSGDVLITVGVVLVVLGGWAVSLCLHEFGHAAVAYRGGDRSVAEKGYLTLDVRRYTVPSLTFALPIFFLLAGGIGLPGGAVWINNAAIRSRGARSLVSLAGPLVNLILAVLLVVALHWFPTPDHLYEALSYLAEIQVLAFILNILPVPGLDGWGAAEPFLSRENQEFGRRARQWAPLILLLLLLGVPPVARAFFGLGQLAYAVLGGDPSAADFGYSLFMFWRR